MKLSNILTTAALLSASALGTACHEDSPITNPPVEKTTVEIERGAYARGADVSWLTQLENEGYTFSSTDGTQMECMKLLRDDCGVNAIRLRVWVDPTDGWCNADDVVLKARRANALGLRLMIDFHMSDTWADPGQQATPAAWADMDLPELTAAVKAHVTEVLSRLEAEGIEAEWVQIGNETRQGFLYPLGSIDNPANFTQLVNAGYEATKAIFPDCSVIVHIDSGDNWYLYETIFGALKSNSGKYDMIGLSIYPEAASWQSTIDQMITNVKKAKTEYGKEVMLCEVGMIYTEADACASMISYLMANADLEGIFYWEPEAPAGYNGGYNKGCFDNGAPTAALSPFTASSK